MRKTVFGSPMPVNGNASTGESVELRQSPGPQLFRALLFCQGTLNVNLWSEV